MILKRQLSRFHVFTVEFITLFDTKFLIVVHFPIDAGIHFIRSGGKVGGIEIRAESRNEMR